VFWCRTKRTAISRVYSRSGHGSIWTLSAKRIVPGDYKIFSWDEVEMALGKIQISSGHLKIAVR